MRSKWINRVLSVALLFTTLTTSVSYTFTTAYAEEAGASTQQSAQSGFMAGGTGNFGGERNFD